MISAFSTSIFLSNDDNFVNTVFHYQNEHEQNKSKNTDPCDNFHLITLQTHCHFQSRFRDIGSFTVFCLLGARVVAKAQNIFMVLLFMVLRLQQDLP